VENNTEIWNELREISPIISTIANKNVFLAPVNYFETLSGLILERIRSGRNTDELAGLLSRDTLNTNDLFTVPDGYFEGFAGELMDRIHAQEQVISVSGEMAGISPLLNRIDKLMPFSVPSGYFDGLTGRLSAGSGSPEYQIEADLAILNQEGLKNKNAYRVPEAYFDGLAPAILNRVKKPVRANVVSLPGRMRWLKYAAAALVIGVIGTAALFIFNKGAAIRHMDPLQSLAQVSEQEMMNYLENQSSPSVSLDTSSNSVASIDLNNDSDPKDLLNDIPDNELQQYIDDHVSAKDLIIN
jgi:hypothetical protein